MATDKEYSIRIKNRIRSGLVVFSYPLRGALGNAMLSSILMATVVAGGAMVAYRNFDKTYSSTRVGRIKAKQSVVEAQVRRRALQPEAYLNCNSAGLTGCVVNPVYFADLGNQSVSGARCDDKSTACGVAVSGLRFDSASRRFTANVAYLGNEVVIKPVAISLEIPLEVLQAPRFHCGEKDNTRPIFVGFNQSSGEPICEGFNACPIGQFVKEVDISRRTLVCQTLPTNVACPEQTMFIHLGWQGHSLQYDCNDLPNPPFTSNLSTRVLASTTVTNTATETVTMSSVATITNTAVVTETATSVNTANPTNTATDTATDTGGYWAGGGLGGHAGMARCPPFYSARTPCAPVGSQCANQIQNPLNAGSQYYLFTCVR